MFGAAGVEFHRRVKERAAQEAEDKHGVSIDPMAGATADGSIDYKVYAQLLQKSWDDERRQYRG